MLYYLNDVEDGGETAFPVADNETFDQEVSGANNNFCKVVVAVLERTREGIPTWNQTETV